MPLDIAYDTDNVFAKILRGEIPCHQIFDDAETRGFMDVFPQSRGHCLVVPKEAATNILSLSPAALEAVVTRTQRLAKAVHTVLRPDGIVITQFNGASAGQSVFHLHFHVIPRYEGDPPIGHGSAGRANDGELAALADTIAQAYEAQT